MNGVEDDGGRCGESKFLRPGMFLGARVPGDNVDRIDVGAGLRELAEIFDPPGSRTMIVIEHALQRWGRGEEEAAERAATDKRFYGVDMTSWRRVLAAARASGELSPEHEESNNQKDSQ